MAPKKKEWKWETSWAKEVIRLALINGEITSTTSYDTIHKFHPEIAKTDRSKLPNRVRGLRQQVARDNGLAQSDAADLEHDRAIYPEPTHNYKGEPRWPGSMAESKLKAAVAAGEHLTLTPAEFYKSLEEYFEPYSLETIRKHIYQEVKFQKYCDWRNDKPKKAFGFIKSFKLFYLNFFGTEMTFFDR